MPEPSTTQGSASGCDRCGREAALTFAPEYCAHFCERCAADPQAASSSPARPDCPGCQSLLHIQAKDRAVTDRYAEALRERGVTAHMLLAQEDPDA